MTSPIHLLNVAGVSAWIDELSRAMLDSGDLERLVAEDSIRGVTSNPTIFAKAITGSTDYDEQVAEMAGRGAETTEIITTLMADDLRRACDVLAEVHRDTNGRDGFVSVEVTPSLAHDSEATIAEAREWVKSIDRPNLLIKVPATEAGLPAIEQLTAEGISVNITLIFSLDRYRAVMGSYLTGLNRAAADGIGLAGIASVGSFFVSRMDVEVDARLDEIGSEAALSLRGKTAIANAQLAYEAYEDTFRGDQWQQLVSNGARVQRPLWASTSTKDPSYPDTMYVDALVAHHTVNTMPIETVRAYQEHGKPPIGFGPEEIAHAHSVLDDMAAVGIGYDDVMEVLEREGVEKFTASWDEVVADVDQERQKYVG